MKMAWLSMRREPVIWFTRARACAVIWLVRNQSCGTSEGALLMIAILVSLSRKTSLK